MTTTLRPLGDSRYGVHRDGGPMKAVVFGRWDGWDLYRRFPCTGTPERTFGRVADARRWLRSEEGQAWLDAAPVELRRPS